MTHPNVHPLRADARDSAERLASHTDDVGLIGAVLDVFEAGQQVLVRRLELLRLELRSDAEQLAIGVGGILAAFLVTAGGYILLVASILAALTPFIGLPLSLLCGALVHLLGGGVGAKLALARFHKLKMVEVGDG